MTSSSSKHLPGTEGLPLPEAAKKAAKHATENSLDFVSFDCRNIQTYPSDPPSVKRKVVNLNVHKGMLRTDKRIQTGTGIPNVYVMVPTAT